MLAVNGAGNIAEFFDHVSIGDSHSGVSDAIIVAELLQEFTPLGGHRSLDQIHQFELFITLSPWRVEGWVDLVADYTHCLPACRQSPIQVLTGPGVRQLHDVIRHIVLTTAHYTMLLEPWLELYASLIGFNPRQLKVLQREWAPMQQSLVGVWIFLLVTYQ